ncbi:MAG TPA: FMN-binding protein [Myxococcota bacterium]|nr:FMN-binding protein [Myxococcota bacterium]
MLCLAFAAPVARATVYATQEQALHDAFPDADAIEGRSFVLDDAQAERVRTLAETDLERKIWTIHSARRAGVILGYAILDLRTVRTLPEALLVVLTPDGAVRSLRVLAFHEPSEYQPSERWLSFFEGRKLDPELKLRRGIQQITGATLSSQSVTRAVRTSLALFQVLIADPKGAG